MSYCKDKKIRQVLFDRPSRLDFRQTRLVPLSPPVSTLEPNGNDVLQVFRIPHLAAASHHPPPVLPTAYLVHCELTVLCLVIFACPCVFSGRPRVQARGALHHVHRRRRQARPGQAAHRQGLHGGPVQQDGEKGRGGRGWEGR